jgi:AbrB family looped-hinge helix DNA binding protein
MMVKVSAKDQIVLPGPIRRKLGICAGHALTAEIEGGRIVLTPQKKKVSRARIITDPLTGFPVLSAGPKAPSIDQQTSPRITRRFPCLRKSFTVRKRLNLGNHDEGSYLRADGVLEELPDAA